MENTGKVLFSGKDNQPIWFVAIDREKWIGPMSASEVVERIQQDELTWAHYGWRKGQAQWMRLCDIHEFQVAVPSVPNKIIEVEVSQKASTKKAAPKANKAPAAPCWYLHYNDSQFGPFKDEDIHRFLRIGKIHGDVHIWRDGMKQWERVKKLGEFSESVEESKVARASKKVDRRKAPRFPVVARSLLTTGSRVFAAVCRDVSIGGMQVLTEELPGPVGTKIKLNISAPTTSASSKIQSFVASGVIVRELEDGKGFSFRFENLSEPALACIQNYVKVTTGARK